jgi:subtilisin family serine protease
MSLGGSAPNAALLSAMQRAVTAGVVLVIAAGNNGEKPEGSNPDPLALVSAQQFPNHVIIAGSVGIDGTTPNLNVISPFSNRAGTGAQYYLTAIGNGVVAIRGRCGTGPAPASRRR